MTNYTLSQISAIIEKRPNKARITAAQKQNKALMMHLHGIGMKGALKKITDFENDNLALVRQEYAVSNVDMFARLLQEEEQIFTTRGGSSYFNMSATQEAEMNGLLKDVIYGMSLRKWVGNFGINAYRADPMGVIMMEVEKAPDLQAAEDVEVGAPQEEFKPKCYPVYKSIQTIWDYKSNGQRLDYVCFALTQDELIEYGIKDTAANATESNKQQKKYFRFCDDTKDTIVMMVNNKAVAMGAGTSPSLITEASLINAENPIKNQWDRLPAFIISDIIKFSDPGSFDTPLNKIIELADCFLRDRSIKDLQQKYHGFAKAVEPIVECSTCKGEGQLKGKACPDCTIPGQDKGTGIKLRTTIGDSLKIPLEMLANDAAPHFDYHKIYGYVTPDIKSWEMQISCLNDLFNLEYTTYWGCAYATAESNGSDPIDKTATEVLANLRPKYARLNLTADWAEHTERAIANFIGEYYFPESFENANISYGRDYILESPQTIVSAYYDMKANGLPDSLLDNQLEKYINCLYQSNPIQQGIYKKKMDVEPFPHMCAEEVELSPVVLEIDKIRKRYFGEWDDTITDAQWVTMDVTALLASLLTFATTKDAALTAHKVKQAALLAPTPTNVNQ